MNATNCFTFPAYKVGKYALLVDIVVGEGEKPLGPTKISIAETAYVRVY